MIAIDLGEQGSQHHRRSDGAGDAVHRGPIEIAHPHGNGVLVVEGDRPGVPIVGGGAGLDGGLHGKLQAAPEFEHAGLGVGEDVADQGCDGRGEYPHLGSGGGGIRQQSERLIAALSRQHRVGLRHLVQRYLAVAEREAVAVELRVLREAGHPERVQTLHEDIVAHELERLHRRDVERVAERFA